MSVLHGKSCWTDTFCKYIHAPFQNHPPASKLSDQQQDLRDVAFLGGLEGLDSGTVGLCCSTSSKCWTDGCWMYPKCTWPLFWNFFYLTKLRNLAQSTIPWNYPPCEPDPVAALKGTSFLEMSRNNLDESSWPSYFCSSSRGHRGDPFFPCQVRPMTIIASCPSAWMNVKSIANP